MKPDDWSNIAYVAGGLLLLMNFSPVPGVAMVLLGVGSFLGHSLGGKWWKADWVAMFITFSAVVVHNYELSWLWILPVGALAYVFGYENYGLLGAQWLIAVISAYLVGIGVIAPVLLFAVGLAMQRYAEAANDHDSLRYQVFHSLWHLVTAVAIVLIVA